ncbi:MAG: hypothetical protein AAF696_21220, partial [Bacteroidota bacterium]
AAPLKKSQAITQKQVQAEKQTMASMAKWGEIDFSLGKNGASLNWNMQTMLFAEEFEIERSLDKRKFERLGTEAVGQHTSYSFQDESFDFLGMPRVYYRLKMKGLDGKSFYSDTKKVEVPLGLGLYGMVKVEGDKILCTYAADKFGALEFSIENEQGEVLLKEEMKAGPDSKRKVIDTKTWGEGSYTLWLKDQQTDFSSDFTLP